MIVVRILPVIDKLKGQTVIPISLDYDGSSVYRWYLAMNERLGSVLAGNVEFSPSLADLTGVYPAAAAGRPVMIFRLDELFTRCLTRDGWAWLREWDQ